MKFLEKKQGDMSLCDPPAPQVPGPTVEWSRRPEFKSFGDRLDFLSPERAHLATGQLRILPPANPERRNGRAS